MAEWFKIMKKLALILSLTVLFIATSSLKINSIDNKNEKMELLYIYDPLCGWCYGFGPVVERIEREHTSVEVTIISGGMVLGDRIAPVGNMAPYLLKAMPRLEKTTGVTYGEPYKALLKQGTYMTSSEKPSVALCVYKSFTADRAVSFAHDIQSSFFKEAKDLNKDETYADLAGSYGLDKNVFLERMKDSTYLKQAYAEFKQAASFGIDGYPCLFLKKGDKYIQVADGYTDYETVNKNLKKALAK
jgi:putative protein-disulfide isomerase